MTPKNKNKNKIIFFKRPRPRLCGQQTASAGEEGIHGRGKGGRGGKECSSRARGYGASARTQFSVGANGFLLAPTVKTVCG
jgi:hypothetical protein